MRAFELHDLKRRREASAELYLEFLRVPALNCGLYFLPADRPDPQQPHPEDEVYYVISGQGSFVSGAFDERIGPGSILYVEAGVDHRFHSITEDLTILVFFSSASTDG